ncbi:MAG: UPF0182 family protein, partial [Propionibacteriaceae bacterium]|nr:UPF0182 family protein [Propionibacteriaceae bacterium]
MSEDRVPTAQPPRSRTRALIPTVLVVIVLAWLYALFTGLWTDHLWYDALGFDRVFTTQLLARVGLAVAFGLVMGAVVAVTAWLVLRFQPVGAQAYRGLLTGFRRRLVIIIPAVVFAVFGGLTGSSQGPTFLAWANQTPFGVTDARFGLDVGFFVFDYPWYRELTQFALITLGLAAALAALGHFMLGGLMAQGRAGKRTTTRAAHRHIAIVLALFFVVYGFSKLLDRFSQLLNQGTLLDGLTYTGDHAYLNANLILAVISFLTAGLFVFSC